MSQPHSATIGRTRRTATYTLLPVAACKVCDWTTGHEHTATREARLHVEETGHDVEVSRTTISVFKEVPQK